VRPTIVVNTRDAQLPARAREILEYYLENRRTADTLEGIAEWRLLEDLVHRRVEETDAALHWLVARGFLRRVIASMAAPPLYRLNTDKVDEAAQLVREATPSDKESRPWPLR
jgi:hypothetical protein